MVLQLLKRFVYIDVFPFRLKSYTSLKNIYIYIYISSVNRKNTRVPIKVSGLFPICLAGRIARGPRRMSTSAARPVEDMVEGERSASVPAHIVLEDRRSDSVPVLRNQFFPPMPPRNR